MARDTWQDRPDYVPSSWSDGPLNRWVAASPARTLAFWVFFMALGVALVAWAVTDPDSYFHTVLAVPGLIAAAAILVMSIRFLPRIVRALGRR